jgi:hypothetical protein
MALTVVEYVREDGSNPYRAWFDGLDPQAAIGDRVIEYIWPETAIL